MACLLAGVLVFSLLPAARVAGATLGVTVNSTNQMTAARVPVAATGTQQRNGPAWEENPTTLGAPTWTENLETLTPGAIVVLNWRTGRTKEITLDQNTTFSFAYTPTVSTNKQRMVVEVIGDGVSTVAFTGVNWQPSQTVTSPPAGTVTVYLLEASSGVIKGYENGGGGGAGGQVFSGFYGGGLPTDVPTTSAALAFDLDPPNTLYMWDGSIWW